MTSHDVRPSGHFHLRLLAAALLLLALPGPLMAGFGTSGGKPLSFGDGSDSAANKAKIQPLVDQLMKPVDASAPFGLNSGLGLTQAQAEERVKQIRENVKKAVELAKLRMDAVRAKFLDEQFNNGNICIGWGMTARGACRVDGTAEKLASEMIPLAPLGLMDGPLPKYDIGVIVASATLFHENFHAGQSYAVELPPNATEDQKKMAKAHKVADNEVDPYGYNAHWLELLRGALQIPGNTDPDTPIPEGTDPFVAAILQAIKGITDPVERAKVVAALVAALGFEWPAHAFSETFFIDIALLIKDYLDGIISLDELKQKLNESKWKYESSLSGGFTVVHEDFPDTIQQLGTTGLGPAIDTDLQPIEDFFVLPYSSSIHVLLVVGKDASGLGELQAYVDLNGDQIYETGKFVLFTHATQLQSNMALFRNEATETLYVYDGVSRLAYRLLDTNSDGVPETLGSPVNPPDSRLGYYVDFEFVPDASVPTILAYHQIMTMDPALPFDDTTLRLRDLDGDGFFETIDEPSFDDLQVWDPTFEPASFGHLQSTLSAYAPPSSQLQVWLTDDNGDLLQFRGSGVGQGTASPVPIALFPPFQYGEQMVILDDTLGTRSANALLSPWEDLGYALLGTKGFPELTGSGVLSAGSSISLALANAPALQPSALIIGLAPAYAPFKGGILVPEVDVLLTGLPTNSSGQLTLSASWPPGIPPGFQFYFQHWLHDPGGAKGFTASNAVVGTSS